MGRWGMNIATKQSWLKNRWSIEIEIMISCQIILMALIIDNRTKTTAVGLPVINIPSSLYQSYRNCLSSQSFLKSHQATPKTILKASMNRMSFWSHKLSSPIINQQRMVRLTLTSCQSLLLSHQPSISMNWINQNWTKSESRTISPSKVPLFTSWATRLETPISKYSQIEI